MSFRKNLLHILYLISFSCIILSCSPKSIKDDLDSRPRIDLKKSFYWAECSKESDPNEIFNSTCDYNFQQLTRMGGSNLRELVGPYGTYIWLKADFTIPEELKNQNLGFFIQYLHFANQVWINGHFVGSFGSFPPNEKSDFFTPHLYTLPEEFLNQNSTNTLLLKVWCHGEAEISEKVYIQREKEAKYSFAEANFYSTIFYMSFQGLFFTAFILYTLVFIAQRRKNKMYMVFALSCLYTVTFTLVYYLPVFPFFQYFEGPKTYFRIYKYLISISSYLIFYFFSSFLIYYVQKDTNKIVKYTRLAVVLVQIIITILVPDYNSLIKIYPPMMLINMLHFGIAIFYIVIASFNKENRKKLRLLYFSSLLLIAGMVTDYIIRVLQQNTALPRFTYIGFILLNLIFIFNMMIRFIHIYKDNEYLNSNLQKEIENQTIQIRNTNLQLENELKKSKTDMNMAAIVQQKLFHSPQRTFVGWDFTIHYEPLEQVSGDFFDFYNMGNKLEGISIFDVSGHGIAASLVTMLSKSIVFQTFRNSLFNNKNMSTILREINKKITQEKGDIENYLTGIVCHLSPIEEDGTNEIQFSNAGHPHPFMYSTTSDSVIELRPNTPEENFGAIGLDVAEVNYVDINKRMTIGDILIFYTDGLIETTNEHGEQFGKENLQAILKLYHQESVDYIKAKILQGLDAFRGSAPKKDDLTIIILKRENPADYLEAITEDI